VARLIGKNLGHFFKAAASEGHELGLHAGTITGGRRILRAWKGKRFVANLFRELMWFRSARGPHPSAPLPLHGALQSRPLLEKAKFPFRYNSDCRGTSIFYPVVEGKTCLNLKIPTLSRLSMRCSEREGVDEENYNEYLISLDEARVRLNVLTIHVRGEGYILLGLFQGFLHQLRRQEDTWCPSGNSSP